MAHAGQILENPQSGERFIFRKTAADTGGEYLEFDLELQPDGKVPGKHVHPKQTERFEVLDGTMKFKLGRQTIVAKAGDVVTVPPGKSHKFQNGGMSPAHVRVTVTPALKMEELFETVCELAADGRTLKNGMPKPLDLALFVSQYRDEVTAAFPPAAIQRATLAPLAAIAKARGHHERYDCFRCPGVATA
ncbi:MAG TPA: cupin domain-containing protein [Thermoleophilaceae bacterium]|nr:cupin domain-containing protein [Thermoleophilaceae bacterium]